MNGQSEYARSAIAAAQAIDMTKRTTSYAIAIEGIRAVTYALLDLAQAVREHGER